MSIENNIERIAAALEAIATHVSSFRTTSTDEIVQAVLDTPVAPKTEKAPKAEAPPVPVAPPAVPVAPITLQPGESVPFAGGTLTNPASAPPVAPPPDPVPVVQMTAEQLNDALIAEVGRIGAQEPIAQVIRDMKYNGLREMPASLYGELLNRVKAL